MTCRKHGNTETRKYANTQNFLLFLFLYYSHFLSFHFSSLHFTCDLDIISMATVPVINFGQFLNGTEEEKVACAMEIARAAEDIGFMVLKNHGVDEAVIENAWNATRDCNTYDSFQL